MVNRGLSPGRAHERRLADLARGAGCDGVICGHFHIAALRELVPLGVEGAIVGKALYAGAFTLAEAQAFQAQTLSLIYEGVFGKYPGLTVVLMESGVSWLPAFMWRANKTWRGVRVEVPWVEREPAAIIRERAEELAVLETMDTGKPIQETIVADPTSGADTALGSRPRVIPVSRPAARAMFSAVRPVWSDTMKTLRGIPPA